jgi:serine/threonine protein kinase
VTPRTLAEERYRVEGRLGHGGMATVFLAHDRKLDRSVAIKLLADNLAADEEVRARFTREARLAAKLDHPNVVQVFDVGEEEDGRPYIVMELVAGGTLGDRLERRRRALPLSEALPLLRQMCDGLGHAHARRLVHRDVKPQNLLLRQSDDCLKVADFGIARAAEETRLTRTGKVIGTDRYMAPEQLTDGQISPATDVFACGVVADEVLPQRRPPELREIVGRCMRADPGERFTDASALAAALASVDRNGATPATVPVAGIAGERGTTFRPPTAQTSTLPRARWEPTERISRRRLPSLRRGAAYLAAFLIGVAIIVGVALALSSSDSGSSDSGGSANGGESAQVQPAPRLDDPAAEARALADWLRAQGR